jgi:hypothetical protein
VNLFKHKVSSFKFQVSGYLILICLWSITSALAQETPVPRLGQTLIFLSNHPERIKERGLLFGGGLLTGRQVRFQYYHQGSQDLPELHLALVIKNNGTKAATLSYIEGTGGPDEAFKAGHQNAKAFLTNYARARGQYLTLAPGKEELLFNLPLPPDKVLSATYEFLLLKGNSVSFYLFALGNSRETFSFSTLSSADTHTKGAYPSCNLYYIKNFDASQKESYITIGDTPLPNLFNYSNLKGCYGVIYELLLHITNNFSAQTQRLTLSLQPRGGKGAAVYLLNGLLLDFPPLPAYQPVTLTQVILKPKEAKDLKLMTMPEGASNYPMRIWIRSEAYEN